MFFYKEGLKQVVTEEKEEEINTPEKVYHVANPDIGGLVQEVIASDSVQTHLVYFDEPVEFPPLERKSRTWACNPDLLYPSSEEAWRNKKY